MHNRLDVKLLDRELNRNNTNEQLETKLIDVPVANTIDMKSEQSRADFQRQVSTLMSTTNLNKNELSKALKDAFSIGWDNKKMIYDNEKKFLKMMSDLRTNYEQVARKDSLNIQEKVRQEMYDQIQ